MRLMAVHGGPLFFLVVEGENMGVVWNQRRELPGTYIPRVLNASATQPHVCCFLSGRKDVFECYTHWIPSEKRSVPCEGDECANCNRAVAWKAYLPILYCAANLPTEGSWATIDRIPPNYSKAYWQKRVLQLTSSAEHLLEACEVGRVFQLRRSGSYENGLIVFRFEQLKINGVENQSFDVRMSMYRAWGIATSSGSVQQPHMPPSELPSEDGETKKRVTKKRPSSKRKT